MRDFIWFIIIGAVLVLLSAVFIGLGLAIRRRQRIDLLIRYRFECDVGEADKKILCKLSGIGMLVIGIGFAIAGICVAMTGRLLGFLPMAAGLGLGIALLVAARIRSPY